MRRRSLLAAAALPALAVADAPRPVGAADVAAVRQLALELDLTHPFAVQAAQSALQRAGAMLHARVSSAIARELHAAVALLADRVGWGLLETGQDPTATLTYAQRTALHGDDPDLHAHVLLDLAVATPDPRLAGITLDHALIERGLSGAERANLHAVAARRAAQHDRRSAREHLARALDTEPAPVERDWGKSITSAPGHLDAIIGFACYALDHPAAVKRLTAAAERLEPRRRRTRARCHIRLAGLALRGGDDDRVVEHLRATSAARRSALVVHDLRAFATMARAAGRPDVASHAERSVLAT